MSRGAPAKMSRKFEVGIYSITYHSNPVETNLGPWFKGYDPSLHVNKIMEEMLRYGIDEIFLKNYSETEKQAWKDAFKSKLTEALSTRNVPIICIRNPETKMPMSLFVRLDIIDPSERKDNIILEKIQLPQNFVSGKTSELPAALFARGTTQVMLPVVEVAVPSIGAPTTPAPPSSSSGAPTTPAPPSSSSGAPTTPGPASSSSPGLINPYLSPPPPPASTTSSAQPSNIFQFPSQQQISSASLPASSSSSAVTNTINQGTTSSVPSSRGVLMGYRGHTPVFANQLGYLDPPPPQNLSRWNRPTKKGKGGKSKKTRKQTQRTKKRRSTRKV